MTRTENFARVEVASPEELHDWLSENHSQAQSVWLVTWKKTTPDKYLSTGAVLDALLSFGWIDGIRRKLDDQRTMQLIAPRRTEHWSGSYKDRVARLRAEGRMQPSGEAAIAAAQANGLWTFMDDVDALIMPDDLVQALRATPPAAEHFETAPPSYRRNVLRWIKLARTPETRARRIAQCTDFASDNRRIPQM